MMRISLYHGKTLTDITQMVGGLIWSGDKSRAARSLAFDLMGSVEIANGDHVALYCDGGICRFWGMVVTLKAVTGAAIVAVTVYDNGIYLANNEGTYQFRGMTPEAAVRQICADYGISLKGTAQTGVALRRKFAGVSLWQIITTLYTLAGEQNGKRYMARFRGKELEIVERSVGQTNLVIQTGSNLFEASTTRSVAGMNNSVAIYDSAGTLLDTVEDAEAVKVYGLMQHHIQQRDGENARQQAQAWLADNGEEESVQVTATGEFDVISGETVVVRREGTGLFGVFWVESDSHTFGNGLHRMKLSLSCKNVAYTASAGSEIE